MRWSGPEQQRKPFQKSAGPVKPARHVPPYLPTSCSGLMTSGSCPTRSATGGSLPALASAASCGASLSVLGNFAGSVTTSGPSSLPIRLLLEATCARAPAATAPTSATTSSVIMSRDRTAPVCGFCQSFPMTTPLYTWARTEMPCLGLQGAAILPDFGEGVKYALCLNQSVSETEGVAQRLALPRLAECHQGDRERRRELPGRCVSGRERRPSRAWTADTVPIFCRLVS